MKVMISQPMGGLTSGEILNARKEAIRILESDGYEIVDTYFDYGNKFIKNEPLYYLGESIKKMSECDAVAFVDGWHNARGCKAEYEIAKEYGLKIIILQTYEKAENETESI